MGCDPRHKDMFVEVDFMLRQPGEMAQKFQPANAKKFAAYYGDEIGSASALIKLYRASTLRNPDQKPGIRVHMDTGVSPVYPEDATIYGDWGGYTAVPLVMKDDGTWDSANPQSAWKTNMAPARVGIFRYFLPYSTGGGSNPENAFAWAAGIGETWVATHESGHAQGIGHSGPSGVTGFVDVNCKPNYQSLMNYAFQGSPDSVGFSDGLGTPALNNWSVTEYQAVFTTNTAFMDVLETVFRYWVDRTNGHVDWNRDGFISPVGTKVKAYINYKPGGGGCEFTRYNTVVLGDDITSTRGPALARLGGRTYLFRAAAGGVAYHWSTSTFDCPVPSADSCGSFTGTGFVAMDAASGIDAVRIGAGSTAKILLVGIGALGEISEARLSLGVFGSESWSAVSSFGTGAAGEPSLAAMDTCSAYLAYKGTDGKVRTNRTYCGNGWTWEGAQVATTEAGGDIGIASYASPAIVRTYLPWKPALPGLYGAFPAASDGRVDIWWWNNGTGLWEKTDVLETRPGPVESKPAMAWVPRSAASEYPGRFYLMTVAHNAAEPEKTVVRMMFSYVKVTKNSDGTVARKVEKVGMAGPFDNVWYTNKGLDLLYENGVDTNLRAAVTLGEGSKKPLRVDFRPKADGIQDFTYVNYNDWQVLRVGVCRQVVNPGGLVPNPIKCPAKDW
ncbi:MAG: hypothetical protein HY698_13070 [Deltaproteobacteria bacterium]|nr:hypothetical protein [Deltaproteobacteria bacterium]